MKVQSTFLIIFMVHSYQKVFGWFQCPRRKHSGLHFKTQEIRSLFSGNSSWHSCSRRNQKDGSFFCPWAFSPWAVVRWVKRKVRVSSSRWRLAAEAKGRREGLASAVCLLARCPPRSLYVVKLQCLSSHPQQRDQTVFKYADQNPAGWNFTWSKGRRDACKTDWFLYTQKIWMSKSVTLCV